MRMLNRNPKRLSSFLCIETTKTKREQPKPRRERQYNAEKHKGKASASRVGHYGYLRRPGSICFHEQKNYVFLCNLSCYCKRNFPNLVGLFGNNKSA